MVAPTLLELAAQVALLAEDNAALKARVTTLEQSQATSTTWQAQHLVDHQRAGHDFRALETARVTSVSRPGPSGAAGPPG